MWEKGQITWENYKNIIRLCRDETKKAMLELNLVREVKENKKDLFKCISGNRKNRENVSPLLNEMGALVT